MSPGGIGHARPRDGAGWARDRRSIREDPWDDAHPSTPRDGTAADWHAAREHSEYLQQRVRELAEEVAAAEDGVAAAYEASAQVRPHAAERLRAAGREARAFTERERGVAAQRAPGTRVATGEPGPTDTMPSRDRG